MISAVRRRLDPADDTGATLVLALILITVVAVVVGVMLSFTDTSVRVTVAVRTQAASNYASDGAAQAAITALRRSPFNNDTTSVTYPKCFGSTAKSGDTLVLHDFFPGGTGVAAASAAVQCTPDPTPSPPAPGHRSPGQPARNAILTLSTNPSEDGLNIQANNKSVPFTVHGSVVSNSNVSVNERGSLQSNASVHAHTGCSGSILSTPAPAGCTAAPVADPNYAPAAGDGARLPGRSRQHGGELRPRRVVTFRPGYYDDAAALLRTS